MDTTNIESTTTSTEDANEIPVPDFNEWIKSYLAAFNEETNRELPLDKIPQSTRLILFAIRNISLSYSSDDSIDR